MAERQTPVTHADGWRTIEPKPSAAALKPDVHTHDLRRSKVRFALIS